MLVGNLYSRPDASHRSKRLSTVPQPLTFDRQPNTRQRSESRWGCVTRKLAEKNTVHVHTRGGQLHEHARPRLGQPTFIATQHRPLHANQVGETLLRTP